MRIDRFKRLHLPPLFAASLLALPVSPAFADMALEQAKIIIEHNATDLDTGFQAFVDADGWEKLEIKGPDGVVVEFSGKGTLNQFGLTEVFFETTGPENAKLPLEKILATMPEGDYEFTASAAKDGGGSGTMTGNAVLSHKIPAGVTLIEPEAGAAVPFDKVKVRWTAVDKALDGSPVTIIAYQLIVEKDEDPLPKMIGKRGLSAYLPAKITELTLPAGFLEPGTAYKWEVLAIAESGNQTLRSSTFKTQ